WINRSVPFGLWCDSLRARSPAQRSRISVAESALAGVSGNSDDPQRWPRFWIWPAEHCRDQEAECGGAIVVAEPLRASHFLRQSLAKFVWIGSQFEDRHPQDAHCVEQGALVFAQRPIDRKSR